MAPVGLGTAGPNLLVAHRKGITRRDLEPANVMVTAEGRVRVVDLGLATLTEPERTRLDDAVRSFHESVERGESYGELRPSKLNLLLDDEALAGRSQDRVPVSNTEYPFIMRVGHYEDAQDHYAPKFPRLFENEAPQIHWNNVAPAIDIPASLLKSGERQRGEMSSEKCQAFLEAQPDGVRRASCWLEPMFVYVLPGRKADALAACRKAVDQHWRWNEWFGVWRSLLLDPKIDSIVGDPRFEAALVDVRADRGRQRKELAAEGLATP